MINLSYSRISLSDIAQKLQLDSPEDAEFIVAKASIITILLERCSFLVFWKLPNSSQSFVFCS